MSLIEKIRADQLAARKDRDVAKASLLTTLIGEAVMIGKNAGNRESTDDEVVAIIKKFIKNIDETLNIIPDEAAGVPKAEKVILTGYLPKQLTATELNNILTEAFRHQACEPKLKGEMMKFLKNNYAGSYDGKLASEVVGLILINGATKL